jgi:hypothetical protein
MTSPRLQMFQRNASVLAAAAILIASGLVHGFWADRWTTSSLLQEAALRVERVPLDCGDWKAQPLDVDPAPFLQAGAQQFWTRSYASARKKTALLVILMCGRAGRMAVHTPEVCYRGAGYELSETPAPVTVQDLGGQSLGTFWTARFNKDSRGASGLRLYWSWNAGTTWQAAQNPRWDFGGEPFLYKLYLSQDAPAATEAAQDFLRQFLPELRRTLEHGD